MRINTKRKTNVQRTKLNQNNDEINFLVMCFDLTIASVDPKSIKIWLSPTSTNAIAITPKASGPNNLARIIGVINEKINLVKLVRVDHTKALEFSGFTVHLLKIVMHLLIYINFQ